MTRRLEFSDVYVNLTPEEQKAFREISEGYSLDVRCIAGEWLRTMGKGFWGVVFEIWICSDLKDVQYNQRPW
jgi:hypothetical protein